MIENGVAGSLDVITIMFGIVFLWSTLVVTIGLLIPRRKVAKADRFLKFAVLVCARNEESVIRLPVKSVYMTSYPKDKLEVIVLADNCTDRTAEIARAAGATVWEKTSPSAGKGDVLKWGMDKVIASGGYDAVAIFDADNIVSAQWFDVMNDALSDGESVVTGRRMTSNSRTNVISGWYTVYWDLMNELSNRVRTKLSLSGKLTGTGFAFLLSALGDEGWNTRTMVEDVEFSVQSNLMGRRIAYAPAAEYADEQPITLRHTWRQLCRWATGCWQVARYYFLPWIKAMAHEPSLRLFDSFFAILTGMSVAFVLLFALLGFVWKVCAGQALLQAGGFFIVMIAFVALVGLVTGCLAVALSLKKRRPSWWAVLTFPMFSFILSSTVLYTLAFPTKRWKPIPHGDAVDEEA